MLLASCWTTTASCATASSATPMQRRSISRAGDTACSTNSRLAEDKKCSLRKEFENAVEFWQDNYLSTDANLSSKLFLISFSTLCSKDYAVWILCAAKISKSRTEENSLDNFTGGSETGGGPKAVESPEDDRLWQRKETPHRSSHDGPACVSRNKMSKWDIGEFILHEGMKASSMCQLRKHEKYYIPDGRKRQFRNCHSWVFRDWTLSISVIQRFVRKTWSLVSL